MQELIDKGHCTAAHPVPLLFVHGGWHAAWCWNEHFLDFFADEGFQAVAVSLRAHGKTATSQRLRTCSIADYADDVKAAAANSSTPALAREHRFCAHTPERVVADCVARLQPESAQAMREMLFGVRPNPGVISTPMLVLGAADDEAFTQDEVHATARAYGADAQFFSDMGHDMMLEPGWQAPAERIIQWLGHRGL